MIETKTPPRSRIKSCLLICGLIALIPAIYVGWFLLSPQDGEATSLQVEWALKEDKIQTIADFRRRFMPSFDESFDQYLGEYYQGLTREEAKAKIEQEITWKTGARDILATARVYVTCVNHPTQLQQVLSWDSQECVTLYCDAQGMILGWTWDD